MTKSQSTHLFKNQESFHERMKKFEIEKEKKMKKIQDQAERAEVEECTFKPKMRTKSVRREDEKARNIKQFLKD